MKTRMLPTFVFAALVLAMVLGCSTDGDSRRRHLTQRQRDSTIAATTVLPGSRVVGRSLELADSAAARARRIDASVR